ncbi:MAG TPA: glycine oxidase ThiO [Terriglobales bacterium]|nr:glycine oxidase ThiO [Terriglobales bacterium]
MKSWDAILVGGGVIGLSLAIELRKRRLTVLVIERGEPGREASHAAAGMLTSAADPHTPPRLRQLAGASFALYPEFVLEIEDESRRRVDFRAEGTLLFPQDSACGKPLSSEEAAKLEPALGTPLPASFLKEASVDPRQLIAALLRAARHRGIEIASGTPVISLREDGGRCAGVRTARTEFHGGCVVNCAGAWAGELGAPPLPTRPVKGHMLAVIPSRRQMIRHVLRGAEVYLVPRSDGRVVIGSTLEDAGYDKRVHAHVIQSLHQLAANLVPELGEAKIIEAWTGLRPALPDELPALGRGALDGYFIATGHYRNGILLAPITAQVMAQVIRGEQPSCDLQAFAPSRFANASHVSS